MWLSFKCLNWLQLALIHFRMKLYFLDFIDEFWIERKIYWKSNIQQSQLPCKHSTNHFQLPTKKKKKKVTIFFISLWQFWGIKIKIGLIFPLLLMERNRLFHNQKPMLQTFEMGHIRLKRQKKKYNKPTHITQRTLRPNPWPTKSI